MNTTTPCIVRAGTESVRLRRLILAASCGIGLLGTAFLLVRMDRQETREPHVPAITTGSGIAMTGEGTPASVVPRPLSAMAEQWGVEVAGLRLGVAGNLLDLRYRVLDPVKADVLMGQEGEAAYLVDERSGERLLLAGSARSGSARRSGWQLETGRTYSLNFPNPGRRLTAGSRVTVVMGDFKAEHVTVE